MTNQANITPTLDYIKYILPLDSDRLQQLAAHLHAYEMENTRGFKWGQTAKMTVMDSTKDTAGRRRLVIEAWGKGADDMLELLSPLYLEHVTRLDYRRELAGATVKDVEAFLARSAMQAKSRRNVQTFRSQPRQKNHQRDVGGVGIYFGSRKSDSHTAAYVRGNEAPAIEHRFQGRKAQDIACEALGAWYERNAPGLKLPLLMPILERYAQTELTTATGYTSWEKLVLAMRDDKAHMDKLNQASEWLETKEERDFWEGLSQEEQLEMQGPGYVPASVLGLASFNQTGQTVGVQFNSAQIPEWLKDATPEERERFNREMKERFGNPDEPAAIG